MVSYLRKTNTFPIICFSGTKVCLCNFKIQMLTCVSIFFFAFLVVYRFGRRKKSKSNFVLSNWNGQCNKHFNCLNVVFLLKGGSKAVGQNEFDELFIRFLESLQGNI